MALSSLFIPTGEDPVSDPGANEVGTVNFIDSDMFDSPTEVQNYIRQTIRLVNETSKQRFSNEFTSLSDTDKNVILRYLFSDSEWKKQMFDLRSLVLDGFYSDYHDPWYKGVTAWQLAKFEGKRISDIKKDWSFLKIWRESKQQEK
jgi:hypothetical protein